MVNRKNKNSRLTDGRKLNFHFQSGFSLIEVLVAFFILSLALTMIFRVFSGGLRNLNIADDYNQAVVMADSLLASVGEAIPLQVGVQSGETTGIYKWTLSIEPFIDAAKISESNSGDAQLLKLMARVQWGQGTKQRELSLETLRVEELH